MWAGQRSALFISGTASIVGHATVHIGDVRRQTEESLANIAAVRAVAAERAGVPFPAEQLTYTVYVRRPADLAGRARGVRASRRRVAHSRAAQDALYLQADICRADLLVEIEAHGFARTRAPHELNRRLSSLRARAAALSALRRGLRRGPDRTRPRCRCRPEPRRQKPAVGTRPRRRGPAPARLPRLRPIRGYLLPLPYIVYRGTWLKADRDGARALLVDTPRVKVDVSVAASTPTRSRDNAAREGMPNLPAVGEIGPNLNLTLAASVQNRWKLDLRLPLRAAVTLQRSPSSSARPSRRT